MLRKRVPIFVLSLLVLSLGTVIAVAQSRLQHAGEGNYSGDSLLVTATAAKDQVRFTSLGIGMRIRLEVLNQRGEQVFDSGFREGSLLDWQLVDVEGHRLPDGLYGCLITVEDLAGSVSHRDAVLNLNEEEVRLGNSSSRQLEFASPLEGQDSIALMTSDEARPITLLAHDGKTGRIVSGKGGLSFQVGDLFAGRDVEQMRLTADGRLGLGVEEPAAKLDVAGLIRAQGIVFPDGTIQRTAASGGIVTLAGIGSRRTPDRMAATSSGTRIGTLTSNGSSGLTGAGFPIQANSGSAGRVQYSETGTNTWFGLDAGLSLTSGVENSFFGYRAGYQTNGSDPEGSYNSFFGSYAGYSNSTGYWNSFFGPYVGFSNTSGYLNSFFGPFAGYSNSTGTDNSFFGMNAGQANTSGDSNSFFGLSAGFSNTTGSLNSFVGIGAGYSNTTGSQNSFVGYEAGYSNTTEGNNTFIGTYADGSPGVTNATALGYLATVSKSNSLVLGSINGVNGATDDTNVGIGVTAPNHRLHVESSFPDPNAGGRATYSYSYFTPTSNNGGYIFGLESAARYTGQHNLTANHLAPGYALAALSGYYGGTVATGSGGTGSVATVTGVTAQNIMRSSITVNNAIGLQVQPAIADVGSANVGNVYGMYVKNPYNVTPTNVYGLYTENLTTGTNNYGVYVSGNSKSYFGGNVGIGTTSPTEKLHVIGNMRVSGSILYGTGQEAPPDYVFEPGYRLMTVEELQRFVEKERHLPNIPNAAEIKEKGLNLGEFQMKLLEKVEELTLYAVEQAKAIERKDAAVNALKAQNATLDARLAAVEQMMQRLAGQGERK